MGGCTKHDESYRLIYLGEPVFIGANYGDDNQEDDNQEDDNQEDDNQDDKEQDDEEKPQSFEDLIFELSQLPPLTGEPSDGDAQSENNSSENQSDTNNNNSDWQAEKWDSPVDWDIAGIAVDGAGWGVDFLTSLAKGRNPYKPSISQVEDSAAYNPVAKNLMDDIGRFNEKSLGDTLKNIGSKYKGADEHIRTVSKSEFEQLKNNLLQGATKLPKDSNYPGTLYQLPNGQGQVGVRMSKSGETLDFRYVNGLKDGFKIHQQ